MMRTSGCAKQWELESDQELQQINSGLAEIKEFEFKHRKTGVYDALKEIIQSDLKQ